MIGLPAEAMVRVGWGASSVAVADGAGAAAAVSGTATAAAAAAAISRRENIGARVRMVVPWVVARCSAVSVVPSDRRRGLSRAERSVMRSPPRRTLGYAVSPTPNARLCGGIAFSAAKGSVRRRGGRRRERSRLGATDGAVVDLRGELGASGGRAAERDTACRDLLRARVQCHGGALPRSDLLEGLAAVVAAEGHPTGGLISTVVHRDVQHRALGHAPRCHGGHHIPALLGRVRFSGDDTYLRGGGGGALTLHGSGHGEGAFLGVLGGVHLI